MSIFKDQDSRTYIASAIFVALVLLLMLFLTFIPLPSGNKDLIVSIISMILGGMGVAMGKLFGKEDNEVVKLRAELDATKHELGQLEAQFHTLKGLYDNLMLQLVKRTDIEVPKV
jgi:hypothetical protein